MSIGQRIKQTRKALGMSQSDLSKRVGLTQATLSDLENDKSRGSAKIASIANALGVRSFWLETGRGSPDSVEGDEQSAEAAAELLAFSAVGATSGYFTSYEKMEMNLSNFVIGEDSFAIRIKNDAFGGRLWPGDFVIVDSASEKQPGDIVFAEFLDGRRGIWVLRFMRDNETCLDPLSKIEETITCNHDDLLRVNKVTSVLLR